MNAGDVFRLGGVADIHTWAVISDPTLDASRVLLVSFTTWDRLEDQACVLESADHPFIRHRTCVSYSRAKLASDAALEQLKAANRLIMLDALTAQVLARIREGAMASTRLSLEHAQILIDQNLVE
jgi:hypothetical protein